MNASFIWKFKIQGSWEHDRLYVQTEYASFDILGIHRIYALAEAIKQIFGAPNPLVLNVSISSRGINFIAYIFPLY